MKSIKDYQFWFVTGSQFLYGDEALQQVAENAETLVSSWNSSGGLPAKLVLKDVVTSSQVFDEIVRQANYDESCAGIIVWCHTFSPSKMWINGLNQLNKPYAHLHTQLNRNIPNEGIDMDYMNLHQAAHADREHAFIAARMRIPRTLIVGYWEDEQVIRQIDDWMRVAATVQLSRRMRVVRFGDNMRDVAVTEGDKVQTQIDLGWQVNTWAVGDLVQVINEVTDTEIDEQIAIYKERYDVATEQLDSVRYQARAEIAMKRMLDEEGAGAFTNTFEDLWGMEELPGLASQHLMDLGYGYAGEGDWKTSAMTHLIMCMGEGRPGGTSFMEDYTYDLTPGHELALGAHMLEVSPRLAAERPKIEVHPLGIGSRSDPARLVFEGKEGPAILVSLINMGNRLRLIVHDIDVVKPTLEMPNLPVARVMWKPAPNLYTGTKCWMLAGGAHHATLTQQVSWQQMRDFAEYFDLEFVHIHADSDPDRLQQELKLADLAWKIR